MQFEASAIPGKWTKTDFPYASAAIGPKGEIHVIQSLGEAPGEHKLATRSPAGDTWSDVQTIRTDFGYRYAYLLPSTAPLTLVATRDVRWAALGYTNPGNFTWVFNAFAAWRATSDAGWNFQKVLEEAPSTSYPWPFCDAQPDAYLDDAGRTHVLYWRQGATTQGVLENGHALLTADGGVRHVQLPNTKHQSSWRIIQDPRGTFWLISAEWTAPEQPTNALMVHRGRSTDGAEFDAPVTLDLREHNVVNAGLMIAAPRGGSQQAYVIDGVFPSGKKGERLVYFRIRLPAAE
jgi:hypothetical protein